MIKIAPSILSSDFSRLGEEITRLDRSGADVIHIDVMDGNFVPNITMGLPIIKSIREFTKLPFDVHLMIENPDNYIDAFADAGADIISVHVEACRHLNRTLQRIRQIGVKTAVALNPATSLSTIDWVLEEVDMVLLMTVNPGFGGQKYIEEMTEKIRNLRAICNRKGLKTDIEIDGGIGLNNIHKTTEAGANVIVAGSAVFNAPDMAEIISELKEKAYKS